MIAAEKGAPSSCALTPVAAVKMVATVARRIIVTTDKSRALAKHVLLNTSICLSLLGLSLDET